MLLGDLVHVFYLQSSCAGVGRHLQLQQSQRVGSRRIGTKKDHACLSFSAGLQVNLVNFHPYPYVDHAGKHKRAKGRHGTGDVDFAPIRAAES